MIVLIVLLLTYVQASWSMQNATHHPWSAYLLKSLVIDAEALSITSLHFSSTNKAPQWVDYLLGSKSAFWAMDKETGDRTISNSLEEGRKMVMSTAAMPPIAHSPSCSFEFLGFVKLGTMAPFLLSNKHSRPSVGHATLNLQNSKWLCYYRGTYDNWRSTEQFGGPPNYWPVFIFCPSPFAPRDPDGSCGKLVSEMEVQENINASLTMKLDESTFWTVQFDIVNNPREVNLRKGRNIRAAPDMAICSSMPYLSSVPSKRNSVSAIFFEWVRHYTNLDVRVVVYDATATQQKALTESRYSRKQRISNMASRRMMNRFEYHDYSILSLLYPAMKDKNYDNERGANPTLLKMDDDHTYSLTHCRFDVQAKYGIKHVLVADFDEFLYCPAAESNAKAQAIFLKEYLDTAGQHDLDQLLLLQYGVSNKSTSSVADCVAREAAGHLNSPSVFNCFASHVHSMHAHLHKSIHLSKACPFSTDHHACTNTPGLKGEDYDCICDTKPIADCMLVHLSLRKYDERPADEYDPMIRESTSELAAISKSDPIIWRRAAPFAL